MFNRIKCSDECRRPGIHDHEVEVSCIKQAKEELLDHHLARLQNFAQKIEKVALSSYPAKREEEVVIKLL